MKILVSSSLETLEERIVVPINERIGQLGLDVTALKEEADTATTDFKQKLDSIESCDLVNITRRLVAIPTLHFSNFFLGILIYTYIYIFILLNLRFAFEEIHY